MPDDVAVNKADTIRRCLRRVAEEFLRAVMANV
jgi:hypothetical protein